MTGARISFTLDDRDFTSRVTKLGGALDTAIPRAIGVGLVGVTEARFQTETEPLGGHWQALNPAYAMLKGNNFILKASGHLRGTLTSETEGSNVIVGSNRPYAAVQQFGATIVPVRARALMFMLGMAGATGPRGGKGKTQSFLVRAQSVHIPARPYLGFGPMDQREVIEVLDFFINKTLSG